MRLWQGSSHRMKATTQVYYSHKDGKVTTWIQIPSSLHDLRRHITSELPCSNQTETVEKSHSYLWLFTTTHHFLLGSRLHNLLGRILGGSLVAQLLRHAQDLPGLCGAGSDLAVSQNKGGAPLSTPKYCNPCSGDARRYHYFWESPISTFFRMTW